MKLRCEVIGISARGDSFEVDLQGTTPNAAEWRGMERQTLILPATKNASRAFHIGRIVTIEITPKR